MKDKSFINQIDQDLQDFLVIEKAELGSSFYNSCDNVDRSSDELINDFKTRKKGLVYAEKIVKKFLARYKE